MAAADDGTVATVRWTLFWVAAVGTAVLLALDRWRRWGLWQLWLACGGSAVGAVLLLSPDYDFVVS